MRLPFGPLLAALLVLGASLFAPFLGGGFVTDDFAHAARLRDHPSFASAWSSPDPFGFYRPATQTSLLADSRLWGFDAPSFRRTNLVLHVLVLACAGVFLREVLQSTGAAALATLAFVLTPKAHPIAVLWISGRSDLLMSLFSLLALLCWIRWDAGARGRTWWLAGAALGYAFAVLSKEAAALLPALFLLTPLAGASPRRERLAACLPMLVVAGLAMALRSAAGALMPVSGDQHYNLATPAVLWSQNLLNYVPRAIPAPIALVVLVGGPLAFGRHASADARQPPRDEPSTHSLIWYAVAWFAVFMTPVLGIPARSELYLYLPVLGACAVAGHVVFRLAVGGRRRRRLFAGLMLAYAGAMAIYQVNRSTLMHDTAAFSAALVSALSPDGAVKTLEPRIGPGPVLLVAVDPAARVHLRNAVGGYLGFVLRLAGGRPAGTGRIGDSPLEAASAETVLTCAYQDGQVRLGVWNPNER